MLTTEALQSPITITDRHPKEKSEQVYYSPRVDTAGNVYYVPQTSTQMANEIIKIKKRGDYKTYTINEVRQKLRDNLGLNV